MKVRFRFLSVIVGHWRISIIIFSIIIFSIIIFSLFYIFDFELTYLTQGAKSNVFLTNDALPIHPGSRNLIIRISIPVNHTL